MGDVRDVKKIAQKGLTYFMDGPPIHFKLNKDFFCFSIQEQEIMRRERELDSTVRRPAEAEKFRCEKLAEATRNRMIMEAEVPIL